VKVLEPSFPRRLVCDRVPRPLRTSCLGRVPSPRLDCSSERFASLIRQRPPPDTDRHDRVAGLTSFLPTVLLFGRKSFFRPGLQTARARSAAEIKAAAGARKGLALSAASTVQRSPVPGSRFANHPRRFSNRLQYLFALHQRLRRTNAIKRRAGRVQLITNKKCEAYCR
jgi:hypothetical protein